MLKCHYLWGFLLRVVINMFRFSLLRSIWWLWCPMYDESFSFISYVGCSITSWLIYFPHGLPMFYGLKGIPYGFHRIKTLWLSRCCEGATILPRRGDFQQTRWWVDVYWSQGSLVIKKVKQVKTPLYYLCRAITFTTYLGHRSVVGERPHSQQT